MSRGRTPQEEKSWFVRPISAEFVERYESLGWGGACNLPYCRQTKSFYCGWSTNYGKRWVRRYCTEHAAKFASKRGLQVPQLEVSTCT